MREESTEMDSDNERSLLEKNKKRTVKTRAQVEALENFYNEHRYPTESLKMQIAESVGLTEKQVSGWFCHRRLKDKKSVNDESHATGKQEKSSGFVQDWGSGPKQDSCGSTKQSEEKNFDTKEVESERLTPKEVSVTGLTYEHGSHHAENYNHTNNLSSGSSGSLQNVSNHQSVGPFNAPASSYMPPKRQTDVLSLRRHGPSGYLKLKGQVENPAITTVKRQLGKHFREDGPPLSVQFDPLPPGAFESLLNDGDDVAEETYCTGEGDLPASVGAMKTYQNTMFGNAYDYKSCPPLNNPNAGGTNYKVRCGHDVPDGYILQSSRPKTSLPEDSAYYPKRNSSIELPELPRNRDEYVIKPRPGVEVARMKYVPNCPRLQPYNGRAKEEWEDSRIPKYDNASARLTVREKIESEYPNAMKRKEVCNSEDREGVGRTIKDRKTNLVRTIVNKNGDAILSSYDMPALKRTKEAFPMQRKRKTPSAYDNLPHTYQGTRSIETTQIPTSFSEDEDSAETTSSSMG